MESFPTILIHILLLSLLVVFGSAADTLTSNASITGKETLVSSGQRFEFGFFTRDNKKKKKTRRVLIYVLSSLVSGILMLGSLIWCFIRRSKKKRGSATKEMDIELPIFDLVTITTATENFSSTNMIGEGGFGIVYKGTLSTGQEVAVKRLSKNSGQDSDLNAKISDFGLARSFGGDQTESNTKRVVGTHGYMSPEYVVDGIFSVKSDVFSFGVLLLEILSGKKNRTFHHPEHHHNLLGHAWLLWREGRALELVDDKSFIESEALRCIQVGLLCVQKLSEDRPTMQSVVVMVSNEGVTLPQPKEPGFFIERSSNETDTSTNSEQDIYIRMPASELGHNKKTRVVLITGVSSLSGILILCFMIWCLIQKSKRKRASENNGKDIELPLFDLNIINTATKKFSSTNMIGEGGFGIVYKGTLSTGQQVAVKRLSKNSGQGIQEFKNEVMLIANLQHRNLVRLLGCCFEGDERMLIYEYMPNKSLDYFIFDQDRKALLTWQKRFEVVMGISRGLLYLHQDSRLRIIHRDLKTSNILLDCDFNPKISDFGIARSFDEDLTEIKTKRVIGTYGYMSPEYAVDGKYSVKSDVFSFGVLLLEIVSGKKNRSFHHPDHHHNLLGHAWLLFKEGKALELVDHISSELSFVESEVLRCIHVGLLCVQKLPQDRPTMASVVVMLSKEEALPQPKEPGFFVERSCTETETSTIEERSISQNVVTITVLEAR
ncbi:unnamed protein product [Fraxinus pennsylvanica]|uniref:non-specific serine/threonine protein kinase n=1 Tax=Fraxinus pennsylvanica TaxID=56036 RepID=A0AAD1ZUH8_9LAMI|nr:unnamed protein product [Fraxinus pennsylvanica]